jgi:hypothetical protein
MTEKPTCGACGGGGKVLSILNEIRPCSRCSIPAFDEWAAAHRSKERIIEYRPLAEEAK